MNLQMFRKPIAGILNESFLEVPAFQRAYVWTDKNVRELLEDVRRDMARGDCFIGTVITNPRDNALRLQVIDGQQRFATVSLMMAACRDRLEQGDHSHLIWNLTPFLFKVERPSTVIPKLRLSDQDHDFFLNRFVMNDASVAPERESHKRLAAAYAQIRAEVDQMSDEEFGKWIGYVMSRLLVRHVEADRNADAIALYESVNDPESKLTQSDLITMVYGQHPAIPGEARASA